MFQSFQSTFSLTTNLMITMMMFCANSIVRRGMSSLFRWGTNLSYFQYTLEGLASSVYGQYRGRYCLIKIKQTDNNKKDMVLQISQTIYVTLCYVI